VKAFVIRTGMMSDVPGIYRPALLIHKHVSPPEIQSEKEKKKVRKKLINKRKRIRKRETVAVPTHGHRCAAPAITRLHDWK